MSLAKSALLLTKNWNFAFLKQIRAVTNDLSELLRYEIDASFYATIYPDVAQSGIDPFEHFMSHGWREYRDPNPNFSSKQYVDSFMSGKMGDINPLVHYMTIGRDSGFKPKCSAFREQYYEIFEYNIVRQELDADFYLLAYPDVAKGSIDPIEHFNVFGWRELRDPNPNFSTAKYMDSYMANFVGEMNPLVHYITIGNKSGLKSFPSELKGHVEAIRELKLISVEFDVEFYLSSYPDVAAACVDPIEHYMTYGWREARDPSPLFSTRKYCEFWLSDLSGEINPLLHYVTLGKKSGIRPYPSELVSNVVSLDGRHFEGSFADGGTRSPVRSDVGLFGGRSSEAASASTKFVPSEQASGAEFKIKVAMAAIRGDVSISELAAYYDIQQELVAILKRRAIDAVVECFQKDPIVMPCSESELNKMHRRIEEFVASLNCS